MRTNNFPYCCGARVIVNWDTWNYTKEKAAAYLRKMEAAQKQAGLVTAILDEVQRKGYHDVMISEGWSVYTEFTNPFHGHRSTLTLYGKTLNQETPEIKEARLKKEQEQKKKYGYIYGY